MSGTSLSRAKYTSSWLPMMKSATTSVANAMMMALMSMGGIYSVTGWLLVETSAGGDDPRGRLGIAGGTFQEHFVGLDGEHCHIAGTRGNVPVRKTHRVLAQEIRRGSDCAVFLPAGPRRPYPKRQRGTRSLITILPSPAFMPAAVKMRQS